MHTALRDVNAVERLETGRALASCTLQAPDGRIGGVEQFYFDDQYWLVRYLVVNTGSWLTGRRVLIAPSAILGLSVHDRWLRVGLTREQIRNSPSVDTRKPVSRRYEERYYTYYDWPPYWDTALVPGVFLPNRTKAAPAIATGALEAPDPKQTHLRSSSEVKGYRIGAQDGAFGHVEDFLVDTGAWSVRYLEIDTRNLAGQQRDKTIAFTRREMDILQYLHQHHTRPVPREELLSKIWGYAKHIDLETRTVDIHIAKLRRKLEPEPAQPRYLVTVRGAGYRLMVE